jgi:spermidine synthase
MKVEKRADKILVKEGLAIYSIISNELRVGGYWDYFIPIYTAYKNPKVLVIGVGGGTMFRQMERLGIKNYVGVDNNPETLKFWRKNVVIADGFEFVKRTKERFDIIIVDAFKGTIMPRKFFSNEFLTNAYDILNKKGKLCYNYLINLRDIILLPYFLRNMKNAGFRLRIELHLTNWVIEGEK